MAELPAPIAALGRVIRAVDAPSGLGTDPREFLAASGELSAADADAMTTHGATRLLAYRALVHNRIRNVVDDWIPRAVSRLGPARFRADVSRFIETQGPRSPYLREVPREFVDWVSPRWNEASELPPYLVDLARYELLRHDVRNDPRGNEVDSGERLELEWPIRTNSTGAVLTFGWAVHRLPKQRSDRSDPAPGPVHLAVFRNRNDAMMYKELDEYEAQLVRRVLDGETMKDAIFGACEAIDEAISDERLAKVAVLLARLAELGLVLGGEHPTDTK